MDMNNEEEKLSYRDTSDAELIRRGFQSEYRRGYEDGRNDAEDECRSREPQA